MAAKQTKKEQRAADRLAAAAKAVVYVRVSTDEQIASGAGVDAQIAECRACATREGLEIVEIVTEDAVSGKVLPSKRPKFPHALDMLDACEAGTLLVRRMDRISRRLRHTLAVLDLADASGWSILTTDAKIDTRTAVGRLQVNVMASFAEYERDVIGERTKESLAALKAGGMILGKPPTTPPEIVIRINVERAAGRSWYAIAAGLNTDQVPTARGGRTWYVSTVQAVAASQLADGKFRQDNKPKDAT